MRVLLAALFVFFAPSSAFAWGQIGHRVTGAIGEPLLNRHAAREVRAILGNETLAEAATWPDEMRSNPNVFWQTTANPWHYVTVPARRSYPDVGAPTEGDAMTALSQFAATLSDRTASPEAKQLALRFTVHIIGDLHQPLHAGNGADHGGNDVRVRLFREPTNLHAVWDSGLIDQRQLSYTEFTALLSRRITPTLRREWVEPNALVWIGESAALRDSLYPSNDELSWDYVYQSRETLDTRLMQAGVRMAAYLNALWP